MTAVTASQNAKANILERPIRMLHVVGAMNRGGAETGLMHIYRRLDRERFEPDFLVHTHERCHYDDEIRAAGGRLVRCTVGHRSVSRYSREFRRVLRESGPYDIVHAHIGWYSGIIARESRRCGVPIRIAYSHSDFSFDITNAGICRRRYIRWMQRLIRRHATMGISNSDLGASSFFGKDWKTDGRWKTIFSGIDLKPFSAIVDKRAIRRELDVPDDSLLIAHVGRHGKEKNLRFVVDVFREIVKLRSDSRLLLVGDGPLRSTIEQYVARCGLSERVRFLGVRSDVPRILVGAVDVLLLPSFFEGLPRVGLETQAAGVPLVLTDTITSQLNVVKELIVRASLSDTAIVWARKAVSAAEDLRMSRQGSLEVMKSSPFNVESSCRRYFEALQTAVENSMAQIP